MFLIQGLEEMMAFGGKKKQNLMFPSPATGEVAPKPSSPIAISTYSNPLPQLPPTREIWKMIPDEPRQFKDASARACENGTSDKPVNNRRLGQLPLKVPQIKGQKAEDPPRHISMFGAQRCSAIDHPHVPAESVQSETDPLIPISLGQHQGPVLGHLDLPLLKRALRKRSKHYRRALLSKATSPDLERV